MREDVKTSGGFFADLVAQRVASLPKKTSSPRGEKASNREDAQSSFLPDLPKSPKVKAPQNPCAGCPAQGRPQTMPTFPEHCDLVLIDDRTPKAEYMAISPHTRDLLAPASIDPERVGIASLTRCQTEGPVHGDEWKKMQRHCEGWLKRDLPLGAALLVQGDEAVYAVKGERDHGAAYWRGLWFKSVIDDRRAFCVKANDRLEEDLARCGRTLHGAPPQLSYLEIVTDPREWPELMQWLAEHLGPWAFDIECFDAGAFPSRESVVFDACHPDYRVRGVSIAWSEDEGVWLEMAPLGPDVWKPWLDPIFSSPARKGGHNKHTDTEGLIVGGWITDVVNGCMDSMLAWNSLSDGRHASLRLERLAVDVLDQDPWWSGANKGRMRDLSLDDVAYGAVMDAGLSLWLCLAGEERMVNQEYWDGR